jgi:hypothetical protein
MSHQENKEQVIAKLRDTILAKQFVIATLRKNQQHQPQSTCSLLFQQEASFPCTSYDEVEALAATPTKFVKNGQLHSIKKKNFINSASKVIKIFGNLITPLHT